MSAEAPAMPPVSEQHNLPHDRHCFVVMPYGRNPAEIRWFKGWYDVVVRPAVTSAGYESKLSAAEEQPSAINDEIRAHLAFDPMVVVDLGGASPDMDPNPNVMYELGIRHALNLPVVMMAWKDQRLPFDVGNQRVIKESRDLLDLEVNRSKLVAFIKAAEAGNFYRPMEAVGRVAELEAASVSLSQDSVLAALVHEVRDLRERLTAAVKPWKPRARGPVVRRFLQGENRALRQRLYKVFVESGGSPQFWTKVLQQELSEDAVKNMALWTADSWIQYVKEQASRWSAPTQVIGGNLPEIDPEDLGKFGPVAASDSKNPDSATPTSSDEAISNDDVSKTDENKT